MATDNRTKKKTAVEKKISSDDVAFVERVKQLVRLVERSNIDQLEVAFDSERMVSIVKNPPVPALNYNPVETQRIASAPAPAPATIEKKEAGEEKSPAIEIRAPIVGTFYRKPSPDAEPYAKEGDNVQKGQVVCIIEAMKIFNEIRSQVSGKVKKIMVEDGHPVEYDQVLFLLEP